MMRLLRPPPSGIFQRSFRLHSPRYARETIAGICSLGDALATAIIGQTGSSCSIMSLLACNGDNSYCQVSAATPHPVGKFPGQCRGALVRAESHVGINNPDIAG